MARSGLDKDPKRTVRIARVESTGMGVADGPHPVEVPGTLPDEEVRVHVEHVGRRRSYARGVHVVSPSPHRVEAGCPHFLACGGCQLLHAEGRFQRRLKRGWVADALGRRPDEVDAVIPSPRDLGYRAFAKLVVGPGGVLGSYRPRTHDVQSMAGCRIHAAPVERIAEAVRADFEAHGVPSGLRYVLIRASMAEGAALVTLVTAKDDAPGLAELSARLGALEVVQAVSQHVNPSEGDALWGDGPTYPLVAKGPLFEHVGPIVQDLLSGAFSQVNPEGAALLYEHVAEALAGAGRVADLYAGSGGIAQTIRLHGAERVVAVEATPAAAAALDGAAERWNAERPGSFEVRHGDVEAHLDALRGVDAAVVNPPRRGLAPKLTRALVERGPLRLVYVSCNPASLARDLEELGSAYDVERVTPFDLFPQTRHVETVVILGRVSPARP